MYKVNFVQVPWATTQLQCGFFPQTPQFTLNTPPLKNCFDLANVNKSESDPVTCIKNNYCIITIGTWSVLLLVILFAKVGHTEATVDLDNLFILLGGSLKEIEVKVLH